jgi:hypothetical protein
MITEFTVTEDGAEGQVEFPLFGTTVDLLVFGDVPYDYVSACGDALASLPDSLVRSLTAATARYRDSSVGFWRRKSRSGNPDEVLEHVKPLCLVVWPPQGPGVALSLEFNCDWSTEHGMEWYVRDSEAMYVGPVQGETPWTTPPSPPPNYAA